MSRTARTREEAAAALGMRLREVIAVQRRATDDVVTTHDGVRTVIGDDGSLTFYAPGSVKPLPSSRGARLAPPPDAPELPPSLPPVVDVDHPASGDDPTTTNLPDGPLEDDGPPPGPTDAVLDWVGQDTDRARRALDAELAAAAPRKGLTEQLRKLLGEDPGA